MRVTMFSNFLNHHQLPFCKKMLKLTNGQFTFVATEPTPKERIKMGYHDMNKSYKFVITTYDSDVNKKNADKLCMESDIVIVGSAPDKYVIDRAKNNLLTFRYRERLYKTGRWHAFSPKNIISIIKNHLILTGKPVYILCASAYTAFDFAMLGCYIGKTYKWGYFPETRIHDLNKLMNKKNINKKVAILWAGRMIEWKHPEDCIYIAKKLIHDGYDFEFNIIGDGEKKEILYQLINKYNLKEYIHILGTMPPENVREYMEKSNIYVFTSDYNEGWGAVLNEAMNSACAIVCNKAIGSAPYLIKNGENGLIYNNGNRMEMYSNIKKFMDSEMFREKCGRNAYKTVTTVWSAETAAERLMELSKLLMDNKETCYNIGPCSKALISEGLYIK